MNKEVKDCWWHEENIFLLPEITYYYKSSQLYTQQYQMKIDKR